MGQGNKTVHRVVDDLSFIVWLAAHLFLFLSASDQIKTFKLKLNEWRKLKYFGPTTKLIY
jgi:hypothetical protein